LGSGRPKENAELKELVTPISTSGWDRKRSERLRASMSDEEVAALTERYERDPASLSLDEDGVLYLVTRERIRAIEDKAKSVGGGNK